jgi:Fe-S-cluster containining protein
MKPAFPSALTVERLRYLIVKHLNRYRALLKRAESGGRNIDISECKRLLDVWMRIDMAGGSLEPDSYSMGGLREIREAYNDEDWSVPDDQLISVEQLLRNYRDSFADAAINVRLSARTHAENNRRAITCETGCANCCYQKILVGAAEGMVIYDELKRTGRWTADMQAKLAMSDREMTASNHRVFFGKKIPCAFLQETSPGHGMCTVYGSRPMGCAATFSIGGDPAYCRQDLQDSLKGQFQVFSHTQTIAAFFSAHTHMQHGLEGGAEQEDATVLMTLPGAVLWAGAKAEHEPPPAVFRLPYIAGSMGKSLDDFDLTAVNREIAQE